MNKKGDALMILSFFIILFMILFVGVILAFGGAITNWVGDEATPLLTDLGVVESTNFTDIAEYTITPLNNFVQQSTWLTGVLYILLLIGSVGMVFAMRINPSKWMIGVYFFGIIALIMGSFLISNIYEDFYDDDTAIGERLQEQTIISFLIIYSPVVFTIIGFLTGIILFSGMQEEEFG